jgi:hypothetical protein
MRDLINEAFDAAIAMKPPHFARLAALGVTRETIATCMDATAPFIPVGVMRIETDERGGFQPFDGGPLAVVQPVVVEGEIIDLVAWHSDDPLRWWTRRGVAWALGEDAINSAHLGWQPEDISVRVEPSPLDWLRGGGSGVCVLDWASAERHQLRGLHSLRVSSSDFAAMLQRSLSEPPRLPAIVIENMGDLNVAA